VIRYVESTQTLEGLYGGRHLQVFDVERDVYRAVLAADDVAAALYSLLGRHEHRQEWALSALLAEMSGILLVEEPIDVHTVGVGGETPLHVAAVWGDLGAIEVLLSRGADPRKGGEDDLTALDNAAQFGWCRCARALLEAGSDPDRNNDMGWTARRWVMQHGSGAMRAVFEGAR
jgi:ankyrin repeat protein